MISYTFNHKVSGMEPAENSLYPKLSVIYNKIMYLGLGILLLVGVLTVWLFGQAQVEEHIDKHYGKVTRIYAEQIGSALSVMVDKNQPELIGHYLAELEKNALVEHVRFYDQQGKILWHSDNSIGMTAFYQNGDVNPQTYVNGTPALVYVEEVRSDALQGYVRISLNQSILADEAKSSAESHYDYFRLLMIAAGVIGFLFTQGMRFRVSSKSESQPQENT